MTDHAALDGLIAAIESRLHALGGALRDRDAGAIESHAQELHRALAIAVQRFAHAAHTPEGVPSALRQRLVRASGLVAAQRESLARATAALDRAIDVLMPDALPPAVYAQRGQGARATSAGCVSA
jgi:hypothetical protein